MARPTEFDIAIADSQVQNLAPTRLIGGISVKNIAHSFLRPSVRNDSSPLNPTYFCVPPCTESSQAPVPHVSIFRFAGTEIQLQSGDAC